MTDGPLDPVPFLARRAGCGAMTRHNVGQWDHCDQTPTHAGTIHFRYPKPTKAYGFACPQHADQLEQAHPVTPDDEAELARRRAGT